jgi:3,4-dihydroxy 2-butanone 4-phosphate synthase/GTP cyclohydrolase II
MQRIAEEGTGVAIVLRQKEDVDQLSRHIKDYEMQDKGIPVPEKEKSDDLRTYGIGAQILIDLGVKKMKVMSTPKKMHALSGFELEVVEYVEQ